MDSFAHNLNVGSNLHTNLHTQRGREDRCEDVEPIEIIEETSKN